MSRNCDTGDHGQAQPKSKQTVATRHCTLRYATAPRGSGEERCSALSLGLEHWRKNVDGELPLDRGTLPGIPAEDVAEYRRNLPTHEVRLVPFVFV